MTIKVGHGASDIKIKDISLALNVDFSKSYIDFLLRLNGVAIFGDSYCTIPFEKVDDGEVDFQALYGLDGKNKNFDLQSNNDIRNETTSLSSPFVIGGDSGGNYYLMNANGVDEAVYYWDRSHIHFDNNFDYPESNEEGNIYKLADSFDSFFQIVVENVIGGNDFVISDLW